MEAEPIRLATMLLYTFTFGLLCGFINDVNRISRIFMGVRYDTESSDKLYGLTIPLVKKSLSELRVYKYSTLKKVLVGMVIFFQDIGLFVFGGVGVSVLNYYFNNGRLRIYAPLAAVIGFAVYFFTVGRIVIRFGEVISFLIKAVLAMLFVTIYRPIRFATEKICKICKKILKKFGKTIAKRQEKVYNNSKKNFVIKEARKGYISIEK